MNSNLKTVSLENNLFDTFILTVRNNGHLFDCIQDQDCKYNSFLRNCTVRGKQHDIWRPQFRLAHFDSRMFDVKAAQQTCWKTQLIKYTLMVLFPVVDLNMYGAVTCVK